MRECGVRILVVLLLSALSASAQENPRVEFAKGLLDQSRGNRQEAAKRFETARLADPLALPLVQRAANRNLAEGNLAAAVTLYREFAAASPQRLDAQLLYADFLRAQGKGDGLAEKMAGATLEGALQHFPDNPAILERLFRTSEAKGDHERSMQLFETLTAKRPLSPAAMLLAADWSGILFKGDDLPARDRLDRLFEKAVEATPTHAALARAASEHFRKTNRLDRAIAALDQHVQAVPADLDLRTRLGILQFAANHATDGEATLKAVIAIDDRNALAHESLAKFYRKQNQTPLALPHADAVLRIRGGDPSEFLALADEWLGVNQPKAARILLEKAAFDHPADPAIAAKLAIATHRDPETRGKASVLFREAESVIPTDAPADPAFLAESASALIDEHRLPAAEDRLRKAIRAYPPDEKLQTAATLRQLADLWNSQNKNADAARALRQRADSLDPPAKP